MELNLAHITALDILVESSLNHQKLVEMLPYFEKICLKYDAFYSTSIYKETLNKKINLYTDLLVNEEETLFIVKAHIPYLIKTGKLVSEKDRVNVYIVILFWIKQFHFPNAEIYFRLANSLKLDEDVSKQLADFIFKETVIFKSENYLCIKPKQENQLEKLEGSWIESNKPEELLTQEMMSSKNVKHTLHALFLPNRKAFIISCDENPSELFINHKTHPDSLCILELGDKVSLDDTEISFTELKKKLVETLYSKKLILSAENIELVYKRRTILKPISLSAYPGQLIGVIGKEAAGKSTLLRILGGIQKPTHGEVYLNAYNLFHNKYQLSGVIGYVPEDDLLFSDLTAFENIEFVARLHLEKENKSVRNRIIQQTFEDLELTDIKDIRVGTIEEKRIQPGQRRLLNIALEIIRDPQILIIDNSKSGLSLSDSSQVIDLLSKYAFKGKLVFTSITQTGEKAFNNFDNLLILNENGYPYYYGSRDNTLNYFSEFLPEGIKKEYKNLKSFTSLEILELMARKDKDLGSNNSKYVLPQKKLYEKLRKQAPENLIDIKKRNKLPGINTPPPRLEKQYITYTLRNFKIKLSRRRELVYTILAAPILAIILAFTLRSGIGKEYSFATNNNIPTYLFLSIIVNIFLGLSQSAREIIGEKYILLKEERINLSLFSYINSKISFLLTLILFQTFFYTLTGNLILEIKGMLLFHWLVYFSCGSAGVLLGLVFSSCHKSYESILLKTIPITLIIVILLGGGWIPLDSIKSSENKYTPLVSDFTISRWAYEAIMVQQFVANPYERNFFLVDKEISTGAFNSFQIIPLLNEYLEYINEENHYKSDSSAQLLKIIQKRFNYYLETEEIFPFEFASRLTQEDYSFLIYEETKEYLNYLDYHFYKKYNQGIDRKRLISDSLSDINGSEYIDMLERNNNNHSISQLVKNTNARKPYKFINGELVQLTEIIFQPPSNEIGRARLFSSVKTFNGQQIKSFEFNLSIMWILNLFVYILLITNIPYKYSQIIFSNSLLSKLNPRFNF